MPKIIIYDRYYKSNDEKNLLLNFINTSKHESASSEYFKKILYNWNTIMSLRNWNK